MTNKISLYLKYRPQQLDDVVGQSNIIATLRQSAIKNEFSHAYLFSGSHGSGKTSTARIVASLLTCENIQDGKICGKCRACKTIKNGACTDVIELDGATNRGIDNIKSIISSSMWSPQELKRKVYILDEVHQLSKEAISALLKTLEEPPDYVYFILCTTDIKKILPTILSRCQRFNFNKISSKDITTRLLLIAKEEKIDIEEGALNIIAKIARGSMRDAIGYLEQIATIAAGKKILSEKIEKYFGVIDRRGIYDIVKTIIGGNIILLMDQINDLIIAGADVQNILMEICEVFRNTMVLRVQDGKTHLIDLPDTEINELKKINELLNLNQLLKLSSSFNNIEKKIDFNINDRWVMEATLINCSAAISQSNSIKK